MPAAFVHKLKVLRAKRRPDFGFDSAFHCHGAYYKEFCMEWKDVDWDCLRALRDGFLQGPQQDYWASERELEHYDLAFAPRIAAKWRAVWSEVAPTLPDRVALWDWGCGTGVASRVAVEVLGADRVQSVWLWDRSARAREFAARQLAARVPVHPLAGAAAEPSGEGSPLWALVSHVWNELGSAGQGELRKVFAKAQGFAWVEPGTPMHSRAIIEERERLAGAYTWLAPCPHSGPCGLRGRPEEFGWCHHFAEPDPAFFTQGHWAQFSKQMGIDLRSLPVSYLVGVNKDSLAKSADTRPRVLGRPKVQKVYAEALVCRASGVEQQRLRPGPGEKLKSLRENVFNRRA